MSTESIAPVDPRVQVELEKLNTATDNINKYEVELDEAKNEFKRLLAESVVRIKQAAHKLGNSIEAAKPYYESRIYATQLAKETQQAACNFEKAKSINVAAKEMVYLAEQGLGEKSTLDTACQEMLSHAASKVNQAQIDVTNAGNSLRMCQLKLEVANNRVGKLQGQLKAAIKASSLRMRRNLLILNSMAFARHFNYLPYYETRANYNGLLKAQKDKINELEKKVSDSKMTYNEALKNLEKISEEIHRQRKIRRQLYNNCDNQRISESAQDKFPCEIDSTDEYLTMPAQISTKSSPIRQRHVDEHDCPHLLRDFERILTLPPKQLPGVGGVPKSASIAGANDCIFAQAQLHGPYEVKSISSGSGSGINTVSSSTSRTDTHANNADDNDIEQWTEIRLSHSESTSSSYSNQSLHEEELTAAALLESHSSSSSDEPRRKVTCTTLFQDDQIHKKQGLSQWLTRSNSFKSSGRRQSLDLLIDAGDKVKDVFSLGFQRVGKTLERRNSESEMNVENCNTKIGTTNCNNSNAITTANTNTTTSSNSATDFFLFSRLTEPKELLSDEQVENLLLNPSLDENGAIVVEELKSPLQHQLTAANQVGLTLLPF